MENKEWFMLNYTLPKEPSRVRVSSWRKLKKSGSVSIGQSMWILPVCQESIRIFDEISNEVQQNGGSAYIMKSVFINESDSEVEKFFNDARNDEYKELIEKCEDFFAEIGKETKKNNYSFAEIEENEEEYNKMTAWYQKIAARDFFSAALKEKSSQELQECKQLLDDFINKTYEINIES